MIEQLFQSGEVRSALLFMNENDRVLDVCEELERVRLPSTSLCLASRLRLPASNVVLCDRHSVGCAPLRCTKPLGIRPSDARNCSKRLKPVTSK
jgi:hypothetical protein